MSKTFEGYYLFLRLDWSTDNMAQLSSTKNVQESALFVDKKDADEWKNKMGTQWRVIELVPLPNRKSLSTISALPAPSYSYLTHF